MRGLWSDSMEETYNNNNNNSLFSEGNIQRCTQ